MRRRSRARASGAIPRGGCLIRRNPSTQRMGIRLKRTNFAVNTITGPIGSPNFGQAVFDPTGTVSLANVFGSAAAGQAFPGWALYAGIFDQYKVNGISVTFRLVQNTQATLGQGFTQNGFIRVAPYTDLSTSINSAYFEAVSHKEFHFTPEKYAISYAISPKVLVQVDQAVSSNGGALVSTRGLWFDSDDPPYILGMALEMFHIPTNHNLVIDVNYDISFRAIVA